MTFYHGSPVKDLKSLKAGSYITPYFSIALYMGLYFPETGKSWNDEDLEEPYDFGPVIRFKKDRTPTGIPRVYALEVDPVYVDFLENPYEHIILKNIICS